jgi:hypothetical protein
MCLVLTVEIPETARSSLEATARSLPPTALLLSVTPRARWPWAGMTSTRGIISEEVGCACSLLADDAAWDAPVWSVRPDVLAQTLVAVGAAVPEEFTVAALWVGDVPEREEVVTLEQLVAVVRMGRLGTRTRYRVPPGRTV